MKVLVVDDEKSVRDFLKKTLESEGFVVDTAEDGQIGSYMARTNDYDLVVLDQVLPKKTGLEICKDIREAHKHMPIIMLSVKSEIEDKTIVLDAGADDYLTKPYSHKELISRIRALLRRSHRVEQTIFEVKDLWLNTATQEVRRVKKDIYLTRKEFSLLELLVRNKEEVVSRGMIMEHVWDMDCNPLSKTIETHILNLRKKIEYRQKPIIINVPGRGYKVSDKE